MTNLHFASKKFLNSSFLSNTASLGIGGPKNGTSYDRVTDTLKECYREQTNKQTHTNRQTYLYWTGLSFDAGRHLTTMNTCWNCDRMFLAQNGFASGSWNITVTMSLPMWRLRNNCIVTIMIFIIISDMYVYKTHVCTYIHTRVRTHVRAHTSTRTHSHTHTHVLIYTQTYTQTNE